ERTQAFGDWTRFTAADGRGSDHGDRHDFAGRARDEGLGGTRDVVERRAPEFHLQPAVPRQLQYDLTGDAFQNAAFGGDEGALSHQVEVGAGRLQDALFFVEQQILVGLARQRVADAP